jgi:hypothetical protein
MLTTPLLDQLKRAERVLIAGAGGGFDMFSGLPFYFALRDVGKAAFLVNLSFSFLPPGSTLWINPLMPIAWGVQLDAVAERLLYRDALRDTETFEDVRRAIMTFRQDMTSLKAIRPRQHLPS